MERTYFIYRTPMGRVAIESDGAAITHFAFGPVQLAGRQHATALTNRASSEVLEYLAGKRIAFEVPVRAEGSAFQREVWAKISEIPYGETRTYAEIAEILGKPGALQAVGQACGRNPIALYLRAPVRVRETPYGQPRRGNWRCHCPQQAHRFPLEDTEP